jgi:hypothetical protein
MVVLAFLAPSIHGHANVHLTIYRRLLALSPAEGAPAHIHILSDEPLRQRVAQLPSSEHTVVSFHAIESVDVLKSVGDGPFMRVPPLSVGTSALHGQLMQAMCWPPDVYLRWYERIIEILKEVKPNLAIVDFLYAALGVDVCRTLSLRYVTLAPLSSLDAAGLSQPGGRGLWKYPAYVQFLSFRSSVH